MGRTLAKYGAVLIGTYLVVAYATGSGRVIAQGATGTVKVIRALQAR